MLGVLPQTPDRNGRPTTPRKRRSVANESLSRATQLLMRNAASVRRAAGDPTPPEELSVALSHIEDALSDLSLGMARMASAIHEHDVSHGGLAWRLQTLRHALAAARHLCSRARAVVPGPESGIGRSNREVGDASPA